MESKQLLSRIDETSYTEVPDDKRPARCAECPYPVRRTCGSRGPLDAPVVIVAESPGSLEERYGLPLIGPSGKLLESVYPENYPDILYLNAMQCFPGLSGNKNQNQLLKATSACRGRLMEEILRYPRDVIIALGKFATIALTGNSKIAITKVRGQSANLMYNDQQLAKNGVYFSVHPSFLMHGGGNAQLFEADIKRAFREGTTLGGRQDESNLKIMKGCPAIEYVSYTSFISVVNQFDEIALDIETTGLDHITDKILWLGAYGGNDVCHVIRGSRIPKHPRQFVREGTKQIWQNGKFDLKFLPQDFRVDADTMLMSYVLNEQAGNHDLDSIALHYCNLEPHKDMISQYYKGGRTLEDAPEELLLDYLSRDLKATFLAYQEMKLLIERDQSRAFYSMQWNPNEYLHGRLLRASEMLTEVEMCGISVDLDVLANNTSRHEAQLEELTTKINQTTQGIVSNPASTQQCQYYLFDILELPRIKESSDQSTLERLVDMKGPNEFITLLLEYRRVAKLYGTYMKNVPKLLREHDINGTLDHRIHPTFLLHGTITGRLASRNPNMQNIPREKFIRDQFKACSADSVLMGIDLNQAELRALACVSGDQTLIDIYTQEERSLHDIVAEMLFGPNWYENPENKMRAKAVNFGIIYGRTGGDIAREFKLPKEEGTRWLEWWFEQFPQVKEFLEECAEAAQSERTILSPFGNKKRPKVYSFQTSQNLENQCRNFLPQNIASNLVLDACVKLPDLRSSSWSLVNLIHDEALFEVPKDEEAQKNLFEEFQYCINEVARAHMLTAVPFVCEAKVGTHWGSLEPRNW